MAVSLRRAQKLHPVRIIAAVAARNSRLFGFLGATALIGLGATILLVISSVQAFLVLSGHSSAMAERRAAQLLDADRSDGSGSADSPVAFGSADGLAGDSTDHPTEPVGADEIVSIRGIRVHTSIANELSALLAAAEADGIALSGWGWRDSQTQVRLRREHCGTSEYAIYRMPSSQCRPPTARPGSSQHERGLAIDFTYAGGSIGNRSNPGFRWLAANAAAYGFKNLASEPWHWSTTGR